jgi:hypothetical protein
LAVQFRYGNEEDLDKSQLLTGEPVYCSDSKKAFIGDGAGGAMPMGDMFSDDYANGSGAGNIKAIDRAMSADTIKNSFRLSYSNFPVGSTFEWDGPAAPAGTLFKDGTAVNRTTYAALMAATTGNINVTTMTSGSAAVVVSDTSNLYIGEKIEGTGIPINATVATKTDATHITMSANATASRSSGTITYFPWGNGNGSTTFNVPDMRNYFRRGASSTLPLGTVQQDAFQGHYQSASGSLAAHDMGLGWINSSGGSGWNPATLTAIIGSPTTDGVNGTPRTSSETRPMNKAVNYIIVF